MYTHMAILGGTACLTLLVQDGLVCFVFFVVSRIVPNCGVIHHV